MSEWCEHDYRPGKCEWCRDIETIADLRKRVAHLEGILATPKTDRCDDPLLTCVICGAENCDSCFGTRGGGERGTFGIHLACRRAALEGK